MRTAMALLVALFVGSAASIGAERGFVFLDGNQLKHGLDLWDLERRSGPLSADDRMSGTLAFGYVLGVSDVMTEAGTACQPKGATRGQVGDVVSKFLSDHPEQRHLSAAGLVTSAILQAFPCAKVKAP
jgi:hypothetical protein